MLKEMEISFNAIIENEPFARTSVASFIASMNPTIDEMVEIKTLVSESVSNAIVHGYKNDQKCKVVIKVKIEEPRKITITVQDYGQGIQDIEQAKVPLYTSLQELEHAGMGLTIIETLADHLEIHSTIGLGTKLIMTKRLKDTYID